MSTSATQGVICDGCPTPGQCTACGRFGKGAFHDPIIDVPVDGGPLYIHERPLEWLPGSVTISPMMPSGWECPKCHRVNAPGVLECPCSVKPRVEGIGS